MLLLPSLLSFPLAFPCLFFSSSLVVGMLQLRTTAAGIYFIAREKFSNLRRGVSRGRWGMELASDSRFGFADGIAPEAA